MRLVVSQEIGGSNPPTLAKGIYISPCSSLDLEHRSSKPSVEGSIPSRDASKQVPVAQ